MELGWGLSGVVPLTVYVLSIAAMALTIFYRIEVGIFFFVFFLPLQNVLEYAIVYPMGKDLNDLLLAAMIFKWAKNRIKSGERFFIKTPLNVPIILLSLWTYFEIWNGASYLNMPNPISPSDPLVVAWKNYMISPLICLIVVNNIKDVRTSRILVLIMVCSILVLDRNFYNIIRYRDTSHYTQENVILGKGSALSGNWLAVFLAQYTAVVVSLFIFDRHKWRRIFYGATAALSYYCIMFLFSRSGYLASVSSLAILGFIKERKILHVGITIALLWSAVVPQAVRERVEMTKTEEGFDDTTVQRLRMWEQAKQMISESPLLGWGFGITAQLSIKAEGFEGRTWNSFHNNYLQTLVEIGAIGLGLVVLTFFMGVYTGWRLFRTSEEPLARALGLGLIACVIGTLVGNIAGSYWQYYSIGGFYWTFLGLANAFLVREREARPIAQSVSNELHLPYQAEDMGALTTADGRVA